MIDPSNLGLVITYMFPEAMFFRDFIVSDMGNGPEITLWNLPVPQPTQQEIDAAEPLALAARDLRILKDQAKAALSASDITVLRLIEMNSNLVPTDWKDYRTNLRAIFSLTEHDPIPALPTRPVFPEEGT